MTEATTLLVIILCFLMTVFCFIIIITLLFTGRKRHGYESSMQMTAGRLMRKQNARRRRWNTIVGSSELGQRPAEGILKQNNGVEELDETADEKDDATASEWGATIHSDGTRSYLHGW